MRIKTIIVAYNRPKHTKEVLEGLKKENVKNIRVYLDYAKTNYDIAQQEKIRKIISEISWAEIELKERTESLGLAKSITGAITDTLNEYDAIIILEDDCVPRKGFYKFMTNSLKKFESNEKIMSVCGFSYFNKEDNKAYGAQRFCPWGWGTWKSKWNKFKMNLKLIVDEYLEKEKDFSKIPKDIQTYCADKRFISGKMDIWSLNWILIHYKENALTICPPKSLIDNIGFDGTGIHSQKTKVFNLKKNSKTEKKIEIPKTISIDEEMQKKVNEFLLAQSAKTMELNPQTNKVFKEILEKTIDEVKIIDIHTHLFPKEFEEQRLSGIDELLNYHYLVAEYFRCESTDPETFWNLTKIERANLIWTELFIKRTPISEATKGIIIILTELGIKLTKNLDSIRKEFEKLKFEENYEEKIFQKANIKQVVMTNDPFDEAERKQWNKKYDKNKYKMALRLDGCLEKEEKCIKKIREICAEHEIQYFSFSLPPEFNYPLKNEKQRRVFENILNLAKELKKPLMLMIGVRRKVNKELKEAGDIVGKADLRNLVNILVNNKSNKFLVTALSKENQYELTVLSRKFSNLTIFGNWWFLNTEQLIKEININRIDLLGSTFIPQHSDARVLEQLIYKWKVTKEALTNILGKKYEKLINMGWTITEEDLKTEIERFFQTNYLGVIEK